MEPKITYDPRLVMAWNEFVAPVKLYERPYDIRMDLWNAFKAGWEAMEKQSQRTDSNLNKLR